MASILEQATANFESRPLLHIDVPEWSEDPAQPVRVYFKTPNSAMLNKITKESNGSSVEEVARLVAYVVTDEKGQKLFQPLEYKTLMTHTDPVALSRVAAAIMAGARMDVADAEKN